MLPMRLGIINGFLRYGFGYWFPYAATGIARLSLTDLNFFRVDTILFLAFPGWLAFGLVICLQRFIAGYFTYRICEEHFELSIPACIVAGMAYAISFSSWSVLRPWLVGVPDRPDFATQFAGETGFPFILWSLDRLGKAEGIKKHVLSFLLGMFTLFSSSATQIVPFVLPMALVWIVLVRRKHNVRYLWTYCIFALVVIVGNVPAMQALAASGPLSQRANWSIFLTYGSFNEMLKASLLAVYQSLRTGSVYWGLGVLGLVLTRLKDRRLVAVVLLLAFCGVASPLIGVLWFLMKPYLGALSSFQLDGFRYLAPFFAAIAAGFGVHFAMRTSILGWAGHNLAFIKKVRMRAILPAILILWLVVGSCGVKAYHARLGDTYDAYYDNEYLRSLGDSPGLPPFRVATVAYQFHPAFANAYGLESVDGYLPLYPGTYQEFWGEVIEPLTSKDPSTYNYFHNWGSRIYLFAPSDGSFDTIEAIRFSEYYNLNLLSLANTQYIVSRKPVMGEGLTLVASTPMSSSGQAGDLFIYKNEHCFPRFFLVDELRVFPDSASLLDSMSHADLSTLRSAAFVEQEFTSTIDTKKLGFSEGLVTLDGYSTDRIVLRVNLDGSGILVITNSYDQYWKCYVDGSEEDVFPVYHTFSGAFLESGQHTVIFEYDPPYRAFY
jgi:hypothetical protein